MSSNLPNDERDDAVGCSGETGMGNEIEGADLAELIHVSWVFHVDSAHFFADGRVECHAVKVAAVATYELRWQCRENKVSCPMGPAVFLFHAGSRWPMRPTGRMRD